jgi:hypothetical protein
MKMRMMKMKKRIVSLLILKMIRQLAKDLAKLPKQIKVLKVGEIVLKAK